MSSSIPNSGGSSSDHAISEDEEAAITAAALAALTALAAAAAAPATASAASDAAATPASPAAAEVDEGHHASTHAGPNSGAQENGENEEKSYADGDDGDEEVSKALPSKNTATAAPMIQPAATLGGESRPR